MNEPESDAPVGAPTWQTPLLVPLLDTNAAAGKSEFSPTEILGSGPS